jgi:hypothetical protein
MDSAKRPQGAPAPDSMGDLGNFTALMQRRGRSRIALRQNHADHELSHD